MLLEAAQLAVNGIFSGTLLALIGLGFALAFAVSAHFHVAHHAVWIAGGYLLYFAGQRATSLLELLAALLFVALCLSAIAMLIERGVYRPLQKRGGVDIFVASLAVLTVMQNAMALGLGVKPVYLDLSVALVGANALRIGPLFIEQFQVLFLATAAPLLTGIGLWLAYSRPGRLMLAVVRNRELATVLGIDVPRIVTLAYGVGALALAPAAIVLAVQAGVGPYGGLQDFILAIASAFAVRTGRLVAVIGTGYLLGMVRELSLLWVSSQWQTTVALLVFIALIYVGQRGALRNAP